MRASTIKNKPIVNEVLSDSVMMKRLQKEISRLQQQLKNEQSKNSDIKIFQIQKQITERENQFLHSNNVNYLQSEDKNRRRTWCAPLTDNVKSNIPPVTKKHSDNFLMPPPPPFLFSDPRSQRKTSSPILWNESMLDDEDFVPGEDCVLERTLSPAGSEVALNNIHTPKFLRGRRSASVESPDPRRFNSPTQWKKRYVIVI